MWQQPQQNNVLLTLGLYFCTQKGSRLTVESDKRHKMFPHVTVTKAVYHEHVPLRLPH